VHGPAPIITAAMKLSAPPNMIQPPNFSIIFTLSKVSWIDPLVIHDQERWLIQGPKGPCSPSTTLVFTAAQQVAG
jgi:hypothetical protein